jgi:hypothetical protein
VNKFDNLPFTKNDENFVEAFAIFCGMGIHNVRWKSHKTFFSSSLTKKPNEPKCLSREN